MFVVIVVFCQVEVSAMI